MSRFVDAKKRAAAKNDGEKKTNSEFVFSLVFCFFFFKFGHL